jgi:hypothetical protein
MDPDFVQRRRVAFALAITVIAAPAAFLLNRSDGDAAGEAPGAVTQPLGTSDPNRQQQSQLVPSVTDALGTTPVGYLSGSTIPGDQAPSRIAVPRLPQSIKGMASFSNLITSTIRCQVKGVPFNSTVTVTNLDNSQSVQCVAAIGTDEADNDVVMNPETFASIADLTDSPVPVQITWVES